MILKVVRKKTNLRNVYERVPEFTDSKVVLDYIGVPESSYLVLKTMFLHE